MISPCVIFELKVFPKQMHKEKLPDTSGCEGGRCRSRRGCASITCGLMSVSPVRFHVAMSYVFHSHEKVFKSLNLQLQGAMDMRKKRP